MGKNLKQHTICWTCANATGGCSWSRSHKPVSGWDAEPTEIKAIDKKAGHIKSFIVKSCPLYYEG